MNNTNYKGRALPVILYALFFSACDADTEQFKGQSMITKEILKLSWEWPAGRSPKQKILVVVDNIETKSNNSIGNSASMADHLPDPMILKAHVLDGDVARGTQLSLRLPKMELGNILVNDQVAIGLDQNNISICIEKVPTGFEKEALKQWLQLWTCSKKTDI